MLTTTGSPDLEATVEKLCGNFASGYLVQDEVEFYVPARGKHTQYSAESFDLDQELRNFLKSEKKVLLLLGESGSGKSLFGQTLVMKVASEYRRTEIVPLFISLPRLLKPRQTLIEETFAQHNIPLDTVDLLKKTHTFLLVLDAYDEAHLQTNLYVDNRLDQWPGKIIISCRTSYLTNIPNYLQYFVPFIGEKSQAALFREIHMAPFSPKQITSYIQQYLGVKQKEIQEEIAQNADLGQEWIDPKTYETWIDQIPGLRVLVQTPFLLKITMEVLPSIVIMYKQAESQQEQFKMTGAKLYDAFVERWFNRQEEKLVGLGTHPGRSLRKDYRAFAKLLAKKMHAKSLTQVTYEEESDLFEGGVPTPNEWAMFFSDNFVPTDQNDEKRRNGRVLARKGCPLRKIGTNQYAFLHASLLEYFVTEAIRSEMVASGTEFKELKESSEARPAATSSSVTVVAVKDSNNSGLSTHNSPSSEPDNLKFSSNNPEPVVRMTVYSVAEPRIPITYDNWVISIMRKPNGKNPDHAFLVIEGINQFGKGLLIRYDLVDNKSKPGLALIVDKPLYNIEPTQLKVTFCRELMKQETFYHQSWSIPYAQAQALIADVNRDKEKVIEYCVSGSESIFAKSTHTNAHSCFTWAREKLHNLENEKIQLPGNWMDLLVAKTSFYINGSDKEPRKERSSCSVM